jgi:hypothetical protein
MGYTTYFDGEFEITPPLHEKHSEYLTKFSETRRVKRDPKICANMKDDLRIAVGLDVGVEGDYFVGGGGFAGQERDESVVEYNYPPNGQPGLWCQWIPNEDGTALGWDQGEKFYQYTEWLKYLIDTFFIPWGYTLNGKVSYQGEESDDQGVIHCKDNMVETIPNTIISPSPSFEEEEDKMSKDSLIDIIAKICYYAQDHSRLDEPKRSTKKLRKQMEHVSHVVSCFLAQNTLKGQGGVETEIVLRELCGTVLNENEWKQKITELVEEFSK